MMLDFSKINAGSSGDTVIEPRKVFTTLSRDPIFRRPSDQQGEVLDQWFAARDQQDVTIKMNTGSGKTLVGLLVLKSSLNEGVGPAVYVTPDNYLAEQVLSEAKKLGISATDDVHDPEFVGKRSILVINIHKLINGKSVFGVGREGVKIKIGSIVIDDAHACLSAVESQFMISLPSSHSAYKKIFKIARPALEQQSMTGVLDVEAEDPTRSMQVPFWTWKDRQSEIVKILHEHRNDDELKFNFPLVEDVLPLCQSAFGRGRLEIAPRFLPIDSIPSFVRATRRIYMTATLADDGVLVSHFNANIESVSKPLKPKGVGDMGDRMILVPQEINPDITDEEVKSFLAELSPKINIAIIVPSAKRAEFWEDVADQTLDKTNIAEGIARVKKGHVGITVFINKYDGVDLPREACELLVVDGLPEVVGLIEGIEMSALDGTEAQLVRQIQRIEQGMGRGVRSSEDRCVVLLLGARLTQRIHQESAREHFTPATLAQIDLGREITKQIQGKPIDELKPVINYSLSADPEWQRVSRTALVSAKEGKESYVEPHVAMLRKAFDLARKGQWKAAADAVQDAVNSESDSSAKGYLKQQLAEYVHHTDSAEAQSIQLQAIGLNGLLIKPVAGLAFTRLAPPVLAQGEAALEYIKKKFKKPAEIILEINALMEDLAWDTERTSAFEGAWKRLGSLLGFSSQRPEHELGEGPDNLWALGGTAFLVVECKSGATTQKIKKSDCNQLIGSASWFKNKYGTSATAIPVMIHPSNQFERGTSPLPDTRIIDSAHMEKLKISLHKFAAAIASVNSLSADFVAKQLEHLGLTKEKFTNTYSTKFSK